MATVRVRQHYREQPLYVQHDLVGGVSRQTRGQDIIIPAIFYVSSDDHTELKQIANWIQEEDVRSTVSVSDSVNGIRHEISVEIYNKETIVLFMLIWS